ncbi:MAG: hypothetical protein GY936_14430 [Ignavibacteriae bacterium]|nr:hypothetical protein [Ignavibacteriota bacterium]
MNSIIKNILILFIVSILAIIFYGCEKNNSIEPEQPVVENRGDIYGSVQFAQYTTNEINNLFTALGVTVPFETKYSVRVIKISYLTVDHNGNDTKASGALMIPITRNDLPLFGLQHGTVAKRENVVSSGEHTSAEGLSGLLSTSIGYVTCIPDYIGFGESDLMHPYIHAKSLSTCIIDFLRASKIYCTENNISLNQQIFLGGYSEGGYATLATQKEIELNYFDEFQLTAVAPAAGPYDLIGTTDIIFKQENYRHPSHISFFITAYDHIYGWNRLSEIFNSPYDVMMPELFNGTKSNSEIDSQLPNSISELFNQDFIKNYFNGSETSFISALRENTLLDWKPIAPIRFYHGDADDVSPYQNSVTALEKLKQNGAIDIELITIPNGDHGSSGVPAVMGIINWFNSFNENNVLVKK